MASALTFWRLGSLVGAGPRRFRKRLYGKRGDRASFAVGGWVWSSPRAMGRPTGWARHPRTGAHLAVLDETGAITAYLRGTGAAERSRVVEGGVPTAARPVGGALGKNEEIVAWRASDGTVRLARREGSGRWRTANLSKQVHAPEAAGDPVLLVQEDPRRTILLYGVEGGGISALVSGRDRGWRREPVLKSGPETAEVTLGRLDDEGSAWAAWAGEEGRPMMAVREDGAWEVMPIRARQALPPVVRGPLALTDGSGRIPLLAYQSRDGVVLLSPDRGGWRMERPTVADLPAALGDLSGVTVSRWKAVALAFRSPDAGIHLLLRRDEGGWVHETVSRVPRTPGGSSDPSVWTDEARGTIHLGWVDLEGRLWEAERSADGEWRSADLDALADASVRPGERR